MRILFAGTPAVALPSLDLLVEAGFDVGVVLTRQDAPVGRKRVVTASPVAVRAAELAIPVIKANRIGVDTEAAIRAAAPDAAAVVAYGSLIPPTALSIPSHGWINLHFSLLPAWRGAAPVQYAVMHGDGVTGASTFRLEAGLDTGPVFGTLTEAVGDADTGGELLDRLSHSGALLLVQTLAAMSAGRAEAVPQTGAVSHAPKLTSADARIDWRLPGLAIRRRINALTPAPGAWSTVRSQRIKLGPVLLRPDISSLEPGRIAVADEGATVVVGTGSSAVAVDRVQPDGKKMMPASAWLRGQPEAKEMVFE